MIALFRQLILSITAVALFGAVMLTMTEQKAQRSVLQLAVGLLLLLAIINPLRRLRLPEALSLPDSVQEHIPKDQEKLYEKAVAASFCEQTEAYLENQLERLGVRADVKLTLSEGKEMVVSGVSVICPETCTKRQRQEIEQLLKRELGIQKEVISIRNESN